MKLQKYKKELISAFLLFIILSVSSSFYFMYQFYQKIDNFNQDKIKENKLLLQTTIKMLNQEADIIYNLKINTPEVLSLMVKADNLKNKDELRKQLYIKLRPIYKMLRKYGIRQLHFQLIGNISFLRFHKPDKYGDSLKGIRCSIDLVNKTKKIIRGFEEGRIFNGFRNVYPLFYHNKFIGSVEVSYSIRAIADVLENKSSSFYGLLLSKKIVDKKVWKDNRIKFYRQSLLNPKFVWDQKAFNSIYSGNLNNIIVKSFKKVEKILSKKINNKLFKYKPFIIPFEFKKNYFIVIFQPVKNIESKNVGYIVSIQSNNFYMKLEKYNILTIIFSLIVSFFVAILFFLFLKQDKIAKENLTFFSNHDPLTKLLNRRGFEVSFMVLAQTFKRNKEPFSILFIDIDHFKKINDTYGHDIGDKALVELAKILKSNVRKSDLISRWGGEEFVIVLGNTNEENAKKIAEKIRLAVETHKQKNLPQFTVSIGVITANDEDFDINNLIKKADEALYEAKNSGRNKVILKD